MRREDFLLQNTVIQLSLGMTFSLNVSFSMENTQPQLAQTPEGQNSGCSHVTDASIGSLEDNVLFSTADLEWKINA